VVHVIALIDCNNFFVSCERLFRPDLQGKPVIVLSSNDGCAIARSNEVKDLGVPMGAPAFKYRELFEHHRVQRFSANFELYGDIAKRITNLLRDITPRIEVYSIDESFLDISTLDIADYEQWGRTVRERIWREIGIPVSIGIAPTKTLAKLASNLCKRQDGVLLLDPGSATWQSKLKQSDVGDLWGIGWRLAPKMKAEGVFTAWQFASLRPQRAQQLMGIHGRQMVAELHGTRCFAMSALHKPRKSIMKGRTFGKDTNEPHVIESAIATLAAQAAFRLRSENQYTRKAGLMVETNRHKPGYKRWYREIVFPAPTADSGEIITALHDEFTQIYQQGQRYHRANMFLYDFTTDTQLQPDLFGEIDVPAHDRAHRRMEAIDQINNKFGRNHVHFAAADLSRTWQPKKRLSTPAYTTRWSDIPLARPKV
jgi:DNA polymerase V